MKIDRKVIEKFIIKQPMLVPWVLSDGTKINVGVVGPFHDLQITSICDGENYWDTTHHVKAEIYSFDHYFDFQDAVHKVLEEAYDDLHNMGFRMWVDKQTLHLHIAKKNAK